MKFQSLLLIFILFISLFFIKVDANKQTNFDASINVQSIKQENEEYLANVLKPMDFPLTDILRFLVLSTGFFLFGPDQRQSRAGKISG